MKHATPDLDGAISPRAEPEDNVDELISNLNKITYHEGMTRLPSTLSFTDLDRVSSYGTLSDIEAEEKKAQEEEGKEDKMGSIRIPNEKKEKEKATMNAAQLHNMKVIMAQSVVRRHQARRKYKQISKCLFINLLILLNLICCCCLFFVKRKACCYCKGDFLNREDICKAFRYLH